VCVRDRGGTTALSSSAPAWGRDGGIVVVTPTPDGAPVGVVVTIDAEDVVVVTVPARAVVVTAVVVSTAVVVATADDVDTVETVGVGLEGSEKITPVAAAAATATAKQPAATAEPTPKRTDRRTRRPRGVEVDPSLPRRRSTAPISSASSDGSGGRCAARRSAATSVR
jgi:hypothetical protein